MKDECRYSQRLERITLLLVVVVFFSRPSAAQSEVQIMVNGSWDYVEDPEPDKDPYAAGQTIDRIVLVAPHNATHAFYIFSGDDATKFAKSPQPPEIKDTGIYYLDIKGLMANSGHKPQPSDTLPLNWSNLLPVPQPVSISKIRSVLYTPNSVMARFAVSLPKPDYYTTYSGAWGTGLSESKVDVIPINSQQPGKYTTWMVLHYWVNTTPSATLNASLDDTSLPPITGRPYDFSIDANVVAMATVPAISIVMGAAYQENDFSCDTISQGSFKMSSALWQFTRYAQFPEEDMSGNQHAGVYHNCGGRVQKAAGSADCHTAQGSINGAVQNP